MCLSVYQRESRNVNREESAVTVRPERDGFLKTDENAKAKQCEKKVLQASTHDSRLTIHVFCVISYVYAPASG